MLGPPSDAPWSLTELAHPGPAFPIPCASPVGWRATQPTLLGMHDHNAGSDTLRSGYTQGKGAGKGLHSITAALFPKKLSACAGDGRQSTTINESPFTLGHHARAPCRGTPPFPSPPPPLRPVPPLYPPPNPRCNPPIHTTTRHGNHYYSVAENCDAPLP